MPQRDQEPQEQGQGQVQTQDPSQGYLREIESMAAAARAKGRPSAELFEEVARGWREHCSDVSDEEQRQAFEYAVAVAEQLDAMGAPT